MSKRKTKPPSVSDIADRLMCLKMNYELDKNGDTPDMTYQTRLAETMLFLKDKCNMQEETARELIERALTEVPEIGPLSA